MSLTTTQPPVSTTLEQAQGSSCLLTQGHEEHALSEARRRLRRGVARWASSIWNRSTNRVPLRPRENLRTYCTSLHDSNNQDNITCGTFVQRGNSHLLATAIDGDIKLWDYHEGILTHTLQGHSDTIMCLAVSSIRKSLLLSYSLDHSLVVWDLNLPERNDVHVEPCDSHAPYNCLLVESWTKELDLVVAGSAFNRIDLWKLNKFGGLEYVLFWKLSIPVQSLSFMRSSYAQYVVASVKNQNPPLVEVWNISRALHTWALNTQDPCSIENTSIETSTRLFSGPENLEVKEEEPGSRDSLLRRLRRRLSRSLDARSMRRFPRELITCTLTLLGRHATVVNSEHFVTQDYLDGDVQVIVATDASDYKRINVWKLFIHNEEITSNLSNTTKEEKDYHRVENMLSIQTDFRPFDFLLLNTPKPLLVGKLASIEKWQVWDVELGVLVRELEQHSPQLNSWRVKCAASTSVICSAANVPYYGDEVDAHAHLIVTYSQTEKSTRVWDLGMGPSDIVRESVKVPEEWCMIPHPSRPRVVMPSIYSALNVKDFVSGKQLFKLSNPNMHSKVTGRIVLSTSANFVAAVSVSSFQSSVLIWRLDNQGLNRGENVPSEYEFQVGWSETPLAVIDDVEHLNPFVVFADQNGRVQTRTFTGVEGVLYSHAEPVTLLLASVVSFSCERYLVSLSDNAMKVYDLGAGVLLYQYQDYRACDVHFNSLSNVPIMLTACRDNSIQVWDLQSGEHMFAPIRNVSNQQSNNLSIASLPLTTMLWSSDGGRCVKLWEFATGTLIKIIEVPDQSMQVKRTIMVATRKPCLLVILEPVLQSNTITFAQAVSARRNMHLYTAQVWDTSNHLFGIGSLNTLLSVLNMDINYDPAIKRHTLDILDKYPGCLLSFRLDALAQCSSPLVSLLNQGFQKLNLMELMLNKTPQLVACFVPVGLCDNLFTNLEISGKVSVSVLFLEIVCRRLQAVKENVDETVAVEADAGLLLHLLSTAWNSYMARCKKPSLAYMSLLACYLDIAGVVTHANLKQNTPFCHLHVRFLSSLNIYHVTQVLEVREKNFQRTRRPESMHNLLRSIDDGMMVDKDKFSCYLLPVENSKIAITETLQLFVQVSRNKDPTKIFSNDIPDALICCNWDSNELKSVCFIYNCFVAYYCFFVVLFTSCNAWFHDLLLLPNDEWSPTALAWTLQGLVLLALIPLVLIEIAYIHTAIYKDALASYTRDPWNFLAWVAYILTLLSFGLRVHTKNESDGSRLCLALATVIVWAKLLWLLRAWKKAGPAVAFVYRSSFEMRWYLVVLFVLVIGFAEAFYLLNQGSTGSVDLDATVESLETNHTHLFENSWNSIYTTTVYMVGNTDESMPYSTNSVLLTTILVVIFNLLTSILVVNMIIAKMTETFRNVHAHMLSYWRVEQAKIILEMYSMSEGFNMMLYPSWLKTCEQTPLSLRNPLRLNFINITEDLWDERGRIILKAKKGEALENLEQKTGSVERKLDISTRNDTAKLLHLHQRIDALESKLDVIIKEVAREGSRTNT